MEESVFGMSLVWFVSGPMRGYDEYNKKAFDDISTKLREIGAYVFNPAELPVLPDSMYLPIDLTALNDCDAMVQLPGWEKADGCRAEYTLAKRRGIWIFSLEEVEREIERFKNRGV
jgi:hypothetical protein